MSNLIKTHQEFTSKRTLLTTSMKQAWAAASILALSAVDHYYTGKDNEGKAHPTEWIAELQEAFLYMDGPFDVAFAKFLEVATNVKLRQDPDNLTKPCYCITRGSRPEGSADQIDSVEKIGLQKYVPDSTHKTKSKAQQFNRDYQKAPKKEKSGDVSATHLELTELGGILVDAAKLAESFDGDKKTAAEAAAATFKEQMKAIEAGEPVPELPELLEMPEMTDFAGVAGTDLGLRAAAAAASFYKIAEAAPFDEVLAKKLDNLLKYNEQSLPNAHKAALAALAKADLAEAS